jgi:serine/threonine-protein kinase
VVAGDYELVQPLQAGGSSVVWRARSTALGADVALKLLHTGLVGTEVEARLLREARILTRLEHPAKARVFDAGTTEHGFAFIAMELLEGSTLLDLIEQTWRIEPTRAIRLLLPVAGALAAAHEQGVIHRDVKPANVIVVREAERELPKLIDFGLAKLLASPTRITLDGEVLGTLAYASPEQARGEQDLDQRSDLWSYCVVLYHALTGRMVFERPSALATVEAIERSEPESIAELGAGDPPLAAIVSRGMRKRREERWSSMRELGSALAAWLWARGVIFDSTGARLEQEWPGAGRPGAPP